MQCNIEIRHRVAEPSAFWGAHAPSRADCGALAAMDLRKDMEATFSQAKVLVKKFAMTRASSPAREGACAPQTAATIPRRCVRFICYSALVTDHQSRFMIVAAASGEFSALGELLVLG